MENSDDLDGHRGTVIKFIHLNMSTKSKEEIRDETIKYLLANKDMLLEYLDRISQNDKSISTLYGESSCETRSSVLSQYKNKSIFHKHSKENKPNELSASSVTTEPNNDKTYDFRECRKSDDSSRRKRRIKANMSGKKQEEKCSLLQKKVRKRTRKPKISNSPKNDQDKHAFCDMNSESLNVDGHIDHETPKEMKDAYWIQGTENNQEHSSSSDERMTGATDNKSTDLSSFSNNDHKSFIVDELLYILTHAKSKRGQDTVLELQRSDCTLRQSFMHRKAGMGKVKIPVFRNSTTEDNKPNIGIDNESQNDQTDWLLSETLWPHEQSVQPYDISMDSVAMKVSAEHQSSSQSLTQKFVDPIVFGSASEDSDHFVSFDNGKSQASRQYPCETVTTNYNRNVSFTSNIDELSEPSLELNDSEGTYENSMEELLPLITFLKADTSN